MKEQFEASLKKLYVESNNRSTLLLEADYKLLLSEVKETQRLRNSGESLSSKQYRRLKRYDLLNIGQDEKLIAKRYTDNDDIRFYVYLDQLFDIIHAAHINTGHKREKVLKNITLPNVKKRRKLSLVLTELDKHYYRST
ncbi:hypothetical protein RN001_008725 [Aquatica leii]|uniref:Uncharacterized protein n=1 Tax=Aquatica leii TaxID=1421715 RepID=A0AAN7PXM9_9COLE|nr:hypothetical protein RN001_008725 [Aquatica leii]